MTELSLIVPVFNEEESITPFLQCVLPILEKHCRAFEIIFCLDPCTDDTEAVIARALEKDSRLKLITLSRRYGQAEATFAGIEHAKGQYIITVDVDLQDPPELMPKMLEQARKGFDVVYSKRLSRVNESWLKMKLAKFGYGLMSHLSNGLIQKECGDYRLISRRVAEQLLALKERHLFLRAQIPLVGFSSTILPYHRQDRACGNGHYNRYIGSIKMGLDGIFCFSAKPLLLIFISAVLLFLPSTAWLLKQAVSALLGSQVASGQVLLIASIAFFTSLQLFALSLVSEYIARIYTETQGRPRYIVDKVMERQDADTRQSPKTTETTR
jgi:dolichol-phosphate mannosyltransferase